MRDVQDLPELALVGRAGATAAVQSVWGTRGPRDKQCVESDKGASESQSEGLRANTSHDAAASHAHRNVNACVREQLGPLDTPRPPPDEPRAQSVPSVCSAPR